MDITREYFENEKYFCRECEKDIKRDELNESNWCCNDCGKKILIDVGKKII